MRRRISHVGCILSIVVPILACEGSAGQSCDLRTPVTIDSVGRQGGPSWPNEPAGFVVLSDQSFGARLGNGWKMVQRQTTNGSGVSVVTDSTAPFSSCVVQFTYAVGFRAGSEPGVVHYNPATPAKETYFAFWWRPSDPWQNNSASGVNKIAFLFAGGARGVIYIMMFRDGAAYTIQVEPEFPGDTRRLAPNVTATPVQLGKWHLVEWYTRYATTATSGDGVTRWWLDGALQGAYADVQTPGDSGFVEYQLAPTWGGVLGTKSQRDFNWFGRVRISHR